MNFIPVLFHGNAISVEMSDKEEAMDDCVRFNDEEMKEEDDDSECYENLDEESDSDSEDDDNDSQDEGDAVEEDVLQGPQQTYLPGKPLEEGEELVCDENAYLMFHKANTGIVSYSAVNYLCVLQ